MIYWSFFLSFFFLSFFLYHFLFFTILGLPFFLTTQSFLSFFYLFLSFFLFLIFNPFPVFYFHLYILLFAFSLMSSQCITNHNWKRYAEKSLAKPQKKWLFFLLFFFLLILWEGLKKLEKWFVKNVELWDKWLIAFHHSLHGLAENFFTPSHTSIDTLNICINCSFHHY